MKGWLLTRKQTSPVEPLLAGWPLSLSVGALSPRWIPSDSLSLISAVSINQSGPSASDPLGKPHPTKEPGKNWCEARWHYRPGQSPQHLHPIKSVLLLNRRSLEFDFKKLIKCILKNKLISISFFCNLKKSEIFGLYREICSYLKRMIYIFRHAADTERH